MKNKYALRLAAATVFAAAGVAGAAEPKIEGLLMGNYSLYTSRYKTTGAEAYDYSSFDIGRVYVTAATKHSVNIASKVVLEGNTLTAGNNVFLKLAFLQWKSDAEALTIEGGMAPTLWVAAEEAVWKYRFVEKVQGDLEGVLKPSDRGVKVRYRLPKSLGTAEAMLSNGEGFGTPEVADYRNKVTKDGHLKLALTPFKGLEALTVSAQYIGVIGLPRARERLAGGVSYKGKKFSLGASLFKSVDFSTSSAAGASTAKWGVSVYGDLPLSERYSLFLRLDNVDNSAVSASSYDKKTLLLAGVACELVKDVKVALTERRSTQGQAAGRRKDQNIVSVDMLAKF